MVSSFAFLGQGDEPNKPNFPGYSFPETVRPLADLAPTRWLAEGIRPIGRGAREVRLWSIIPEGYSAYTRILHPAYTPAIGEPVHWSDIAARTGKIAHPLMKFGRLFGSDDSYYCPDWLEQPFVGELPKEEAETMLSTLRLFTTTPDCCYLLVWEGYGGSELLYPPTGKVMLPDRNYLAFVGSVDSVEELAKADYLNSPNLWWPEDKAWIVATEIDFMDTYVGGSANCISQLLCDPELEAFPISIDARVDFLGDTINI